MSYPGRFFQVPRPGLQGLGDLQGTALAERGEMGISPPLGYAPPAGVGVPVQPGAAPQAPNSDLNSNWQSIPFTAGTTPIKLQDFLLRKFLVLQNLSGAGNLLFGFGWQPSTYNSILLSPGVGYEPLRYPTNDIWVVASVAGVQGIMIYGS